MLFIPHTPRTVADVRNNVHRFFCERPWTTALLISCLFFVSRALMVAFGPLDLAPDEAQYWDWSRLGEWSFVTKPPLVAWLIAFSTHFLGDTVLGVRFFALVGQVAVPLLLMGITRACVAEEHKTSAGWWAFILSTCTPLIAGGGLIMSPDVPSLVFWLGALLVLVHMKWWRFGEADSSEQPKKQWLRWILIGILIGLAGLAKPSAALFYPLLGLYLLLCHRQWLFRPQPYVAGLISLACQLPVFYWNMMNDWAMFRHVLDQADSDTRYGGLSSLGEFLLSQFGVLGPMTAIVLVVAVFLKTERNKVHLNAIWMFTVPILLLFTVMSLSGKVQANWPVLGTIPALILAAAFLPRLTNKFMLGALVAGLLLNTTVTVLLYDTFLLREMGVHLKVKNDPTKPLLGWRGVGERLGYLIDEFPTAEILTTRYQTTAALAFHTPQQPRVLYKNPGWRRENHYDYMPWPSLEGKPVLYVTENGTLPDVVNKMFSHCQHLADVAGKRRNITLRTATVYVCEGFVSDFGK